MHGFFPGTDARFAFYFPPAAQYDGRFILGPTHQLTNNENGRNPSFAFASGAYLVAPNLGGSENPRLPVPVGAADTSIRGYRVNTEAARFSRVVANDFYAKSHRKHRPYGYIYGGSGGSYMTICTLQQTKGIFDGGVPFISANHMATPYTYNVRILALRLLRDTGVNKFPAVMDAIDPGGSGDPYATLNAGRRALRAAPVGPAARWWDYANIPKAVDAHRPRVPTRIRPREDFWNVPGYAGFETVGTLASVRGPRPPKREQCSRTSACRLSAACPPPAKRQGPTARHRCGGRGLVELVAVRRQHRSSVAAASAYRPSRIWRAATR